MECRTCHHGLIEKSRFCDDCGAATAQVDLDAEALQSYCSKCAALLRGSRNYCVHCGEPSPHSGKYERKREQSWLVHALLDPRVQTAILASLLILAALPAVTPVRYRAVARPPFVEAYLKQEEPVVTRTRDRESFGIRPLIDPDEEGAMKVQSPAGVARDSRGNLYVSDAEAHVVYKIDPTGQRTLFAGTGSAGYSGDGAAAIRADLNQPRGLAVDDLDGLLIADSGNNVIRRVSPQGFIKTVAGAPPSEEEPVMTVARMADAEDAQLMAPVSVSADIDGALYVTEQPCEIGPREPTVWVLKPKT